jgi:hypothetical protein
VLPQVLAGLGLVSLVSAGCLLWLQRLQPLFVIVALCSLLYEIWLFSRHSPVLRKWDARAILGASLILNIAVLGGWVAILIRYR